MGSFTAGDRDCTLYKLSPANLQEFLPLNASFVIVFDFFFWLLKPQHSCVVLKITLLMIGIFQYEGFSSRQPG